MATQTAQDDERRRIAAAVQTVMAMGGGAPVNADSIATTTAGNFDLNSLVNNPASQGAGQLLSAKAGQVQGEAGTRHITNVSADVENPFQSGFFQPAAQREAAMTNHTGAYAPTDLAARTATRAAQGDLAHPVGTVAPETVLPGMSPQELVGTETKYAPRAQSPFYTHGVPMPVHGKVTSAGGQNEASNYLPGNDPDYGNPNYIGLGDLVTPKASTTAALPSEVTPIGAPAAAPKHIPTAPPLPAAGGAANSNILQPGHNPIGDMMQNLGALLAHLRQRGALGY